ncbi:MAG: ABC transporter ATP-binding protein [Jejuia sp.]
MPKHRAVYISNNVNKKQLIKRIVNGDFFPELASQKSAVFSEITLNKYIEEETRHGYFEVKTETNNSLKNSSEGERKRALLKHILSNTQVDCLVLDNVFDCLDVQSQINIQNLLSELCKKVNIIQIAARKRDILPFITEIFSIQEDVLKPLDITSTVNNSNYFIEDLPKPHKNKFGEHNPLIRLNRINLSYLERPILRDISWEIKPNEFWQLIGPNGSGKSTILSLISGDNPKGFTQDMLLFGMKKGSGETVWDIKKHIGFYSSEMLRGFKRRDTIESMIISGFVDSIGLYVYPTDVQLKIASAWLRLLKMEQIKDKSFHFLSNGHKRLVLIARAMVKHPPLLILDEPTNGLDDHDAQIFSELVNKIAKESNTSIIYVSHRKEEYIKPDFIYELVPSEDGSTGMRRDVS